MTFPQTRKWEEMQKQDLEKREALRVNILKRDANPNPDYRLPHNLLLKRGTKSK